MRTLRIIFTLLLLSLLIGLPPFFWGYINLYWAKNSSSIMDASIYYETSARFIIWEPGLYEKAGLTEKNSPSRAIMLLTKAREKNSLSIEGKIALGDAYNSNNDNKKAIELWEEILIIDPKNQNTISRLVYAYHSIQNFSREEGLLTHWLSFDEKNIEANKHLGILLASDASDKALLYLKKASNASSFEKSTLSDLILAMNIPNSDMSFKLVNSGQALANLGEWRLAERSFSSATGMNPHYAMAWAWLAIARQHNSSPGALKALQQALELDQTSASINAMAGTFWQISGDNKESQQFFTRSTQIQPENPAWWLALAQVTAKTDLTVALNAYVQAANLAPQEAKYWSKLALFCVENNIYMQEYGLKAALRAFSSDPENPSFMDLLGRVQMAIGQNKAAEVMFLRAIHSGNDSTISSSYYLHLGLLYLRMEKNDAAKTNLKKATELDPGGIYGIQAKSLHDRYFP